MSTAGISVDSVPGGRVDTERIGPPAAADRHQPGSVQRSTHRPTPDTTVPAGQDRPGADEPAARAGSARPVSRSSQFARSRFGSASDSGDPGGNWLG